MFHLFQPSTCPVPNRAEASVEYLAGEAVAGDSLDSDDIQIPHNERITPTFGLLHVGRALRAGLPRCPAERCARADKVRGG